MTKLMKQIEACAARARLLLLEQEKWAPTERLTADELLDVRVTLDAPRVLSFEIDRLRRLVRKHGGRP